MNAIAALEIPGINILEPWSEYILDGTKTIETRTYPCLTKYLNTPILIVETPTRKGSRPAMIVGAVVFSKNKFYDSSLKFKRDLSKHRVPSGSKFDWKKEKPKWGWVVSERWRFKNPKPAPKHRGYVWTGVLSVDRTLLPQGLFKRLSSQTQQDSAQSL